MGRTLAADVDVKTIYLRFINKARIEYEHLARKADRLAKAKETCYEYLIPRKGIIAKDYNINLDDYIIEFGNQSYNPELALETRVIKLLKSTKYEDRSNIIQLAKWCSILKNENATFNSLKLCKEKANLTFNEYKQYL